MDRPLRMSYTTGARSEKRAAAVRLPHVSYWIAPVPDLIGYGGWSLRVAVSLPVPSPPEKTPLVSEWPFHESSVLILRSWPAVGSPYEAAGRSRNLEVLRRCASLVPSSHLL